MISPSIVGDRFVQLTPAYSGGEQLADNAKLGLDRTATPLELDEIFSSINDLDIALGPDGANQPGSGGVGPLTRLLNSTARNFGGQGVQFNKTLKNFSALTKTLADNKDELFGTLAQVEEFTNTLAKNDGTVRKFNDSLAGGADLLADERQELAAVLKNLSIAMQQVRGFVKDNRDSLTRNISGLNRISKTLVKRRDRSRPDAGVRPGGVEQPVPRRQRQAGHPGHPEQRRPDPERAGGGPEDGALLAHQPPDARLHQVRRRPDCPPSRAVRRQGSTPPRVVEPIDRSFGGLVEVTR